jgi:dipeptidyl aminopeptidase/acylaminoacyl peptidase
VRKTTERRFAARFARLAAVPLLFIALLACGQSVADEGFEIVRREMVDDVEQAYVSYRSGELTVTGWLFVHPFSEVDTEPCVIFNHGGVSGVSEGTRERCRWLAKKGYIVFAPSYRGEDDSEGEVEVAAGEIDDVIAAMRLLSTHPGIRSGEFVLLGTSHGALVSVHVAARDEAKPWVKGIVAAYGVMDMYGWYQYLVDNDFDVGDSLSLRVYGTGPDDKPEAFAQRHAHSLIPRLGAAPIFLVQGALDRIVPKEQALDMYRALRESGRQVDDCRLYEHGAHGFLFWDDPKLHPVEELRDAEKAWNDILNFFGGLVGPQEDWGG